MQLEVERSGGFAGRTVRWSLDVDALEPEQQAEVRDLLQQAPGWAGSTGPDRFSYRLVTSPGPPPGSAAAVRPAPQPGDVADRAGVDVRFADPLPEPARRLLEVVRGAPPRP